MSGVEAAQWIVTPEGIGATRFSDPESFYLTIRLGRRDGEPFYIVSPRQLSMGFTRHGKLVFLRHDVNAKWARHATFTEACNLATALVDGELRSEDYRYWLDADIQRFGPFAPTAEVDQ